MVRTSHGATLAMLTLVLACDAKPAETTAAERPAPAPPPGLVEQFQEAKRQTRCIDAQLIAGAVEIHRLSDPGGRCPTDVAALVEAKLLPRVPASAPSWSIACSGAAAEVVVSTSGPDGRVGTSDDVVHGGPQATCKP